MAVIVHQNEINAAFASILEEGFQIVQIRKRLPVIRNNNDIIWNDNLSVLVIERDYIAIIFN